MKTTAKEAREAGDSHYFTGKPCKHGHTAPRAAKGNQCSECEKLKQRAYRASASDHINEQRRAARVANLDHHRALQREQYLKHRHKRIQEKRARALHLLELAACLSPEEDKAIKAIYEKAKRLTLETGVEHQVDHILPIALGGPHAAFNLQILTAWDNKSKRHTFSAEDQALYTQRVAELFKDD